jgi:hypothetical protein
MGTADQPFNPPFSLTQFPNGIASAGVPMIGTQLTLTSAQLKALQTTPVVLVPSPSASPQIDGTVNIVLFPTRVVAEYKFGTTAYTLGNADNAFQVEYIGKAVALATVPAAGLVDQVASRFVTVGSIAVGNEALAACANLGFELKLVGTTPALTLGDGLLAINLHFSAFALI